jgi:hypothetical protein
VAKFLTAATFFIDSSFFVLRPWRTDLDLLLFALSTWAVSNETSTAPGKCKLFVKQSTRRAHPDRNRVAKKARLLFCFELCAERARSSKRGNHSTIRLSSEP